MYFNGGGQKLGQDSWPRQSHLQVLSPGAQQPVGPPPTSPGYGIYTQPHHHHLGQLHHLGGQQQQQNSINNHNHYPSPPIQHHVMGQGSPASVPLAQHWQQQLLKCEIVRSSRSPHHRARASAMASRTVAKSAIPITNPNPKPLPEELSDSSPLGNGNASHPSSTVAPIAEPPKPRVSTWTALDMGGVNIKNLPSTSGLFSFTFLQNLYLNHNALTSIPPEIAQLRNLELLDLSGNSLTTLPPELGLLVTLKEFFLFDNQIMVIPPEFGTLHQLQTLGVEGNPLDSSLKNLITKDGTPALIAYLRDSCPVPTPPQNRPWIPLITPAEQEALSPDTETISVVCYNILCQRAATVRLYGYTPSWALAWDYRRELILNEILAHGADFICLQEVDVTSYEDYFVKHLNAAGYESVYWPKSRAKTMSNEAERRFVDGLATFFRADKYQLIEKHLIEFSAVAMQREDFKKTEDLFNRVLGKDHIATCCAFENRDTGTRILVANVHILWDPKFSDVKMVHVALMAEEVEKMAERFVKLPPRLFPEPESAVNGNGNGNSSAADGMDGNGSSSSSPSSPNASQPSSPRKPRMKAPTYTSASQIPLIFCGDFNSIPGSGVYEFLSSGTLSKDHPDFLGHVYGKYTGGGGEKGLGLRTWLGLKSAYAVNPNLLPGAPGSAAPSHSASSSIPAPRTPSISAPPPSSPSSALKKSASAPTSPEILSTTNYTSSFSGVLDYIWYSGANLTASAVLGDVDPVYLSKVVGFPNVHFPSDHICIMTELCVKPPRGEQKETFPRPSPFS
ncbi:Endonuclease/exonuclease/phosphatase [Rhodocollybia butyracea]|uniref:CCR4-Not complex 3'-5'-exoribonuclease subunit Ccr4 n=1 Tax=Rhodocollybia butyracea TaxID=206335 RepID=A0A9P5Q2X7_9AGAR|nr:Endonuclease/exonuclease/phosphatase [Rhodocollybia butyracea]